MSLLATPTAGTPSATVRDEPRWGPADRAVSRLLFVTTHPAGALGAPPAGRLLGFAVFLSGARCILRYVMLPFGLPLVGIASSQWLGLTITLIVEAVAVIATVTSVRRLWAARHPERWRYLLVAVTVLVLSALFLVFTASARG